MKNSISKIGKDDDISVVSDDKFLVVHHVRRESGAEQVAIHVYNIEKEPIFLYKVSRGSECSADKLFIYKEYVVFAPTWSLIAGALIKTLSINEKMSAFGQFTFEDQGKRDLINQVKHLTS